MDRDIELLSVRVEFICAVCGQHISSLDDRTVHCPTCNSEYYVPEAFINVDLREQGQEPAEA